MEFNLAKFIFGAVLAVCIFIYARNKRRQPEMKRDENVRIEPDAISQAAGGIVRGYNFFKQIMSVAFLLVVLGLAVFDPLTRIIVLSTICLMAVIAVIAIYFPRRK